MLDSATTRILDASLNRAGEGLRVAEDFARFVLDDSFLTGQLKTLRHDLISAANHLPSPERHAARETQRDIGTTISTEREYQRNDSWSVCAASLKRTEQSLRSLEEYGKLIDIRVGRQAESLRYRLYTLEKALDLSRSSRLRLSDARLCVLVDGQDALADFERLVHELVDAGVGMIQLRDKDLNDDELVERASTLVSLTRSSDLSRRQPPALPGVSSTHRDRARHEPPAKPGADGRDERQSVGRTLAVINDRADIAAIVHADGVHVGQEDLSVKDARTIVGPRMLIGVSTHNMDQARQAVLDGANYLGAGPTFPSQTKAFDYFAGLDYLRELAAEISLPTFAIGGIKAANLAEVLTTGIGRVAVSAAVTAAEKPGCAAREMLPMLNGAAGEPRPTVASL